MYEFVDLLIQKRRYIIALFAVTLELSLTSLLGSTVQAHRSIIEARIHSSYSNPTASQITYQSPNAVTNAMALMANSFGKGTDSFEAHVLSGTMTVANGLTSFNTRVEHTSYTAVMFTYHSELQTFSSALHGVGMGATVVSDGVSSGVAFSGHAVVNQFTVNEHLASNVVGLATGVAHVGSLIRPAEADQTPIPIITQLRMQQAQLIQQGTVNVAVAPVASGTGGACDDGNGNGGYPMAWCDAAMDTMATVSYTSDPINRECTSYAFWYFTAIEGHTDFHAYGNAKDWASTTNYPTHDNPIVGAMAVETAGAYGHVAIVHALPGQTYDGAVVPAGNVLVSEMNYDWDGHFRYSYSPISKFSAYIYP
jgi:hypothetical protein